MLKQSLKTQLSLVISLIVLITVGLISILSNIFIDKQFKDYKVNQQMKNMEEIINELDSQYNASTNKWDKGSVHVIGMNALNRGYIVKVQDEDKNIIWDAETCDMIACRKMMDDISKFMADRYPSFKGEFIDKAFSIMNKDNEIGTAMISYYGPYFLNENDFNFLNKLNTILIIIGFFSLFFSAVIGFLIARRISDPILKTVAVTKNISNGNYKERINEKTSIKEVNELISSVNSLAKSLEKQEHLRKQLTADVAHELRTPITTLQTHMEAMTIGIWQPTVNRLISCLDEILRIGKLVFDLESIAKFDNNILNLDKSKVNMKEIAEKAKATFELEILNKKLDISITGECSTVIADPNRMNQVIINLLSNSIKYTKEEGKIQIELSDKGNFVKLVVKDNGTGISQEDLPYIFERFYRADKSRTRTTGGSGIGLAIVKSIVEAHKGEVGVISNVDEGSEFTILIPKA